MSWAIAMIAIDARFEADSDIASPPQSGSAAARESVRARRRRSHRTMRADDADRTAAAGFAACNDAQTR
jgi:hypothetical protein